MTEKDVSVVFTPYWGAGNPYQDALAAQLSARGVHVRKLRSLKDLFRRIVCLSGEVEVVHLHWLPVFSWRGLSSLRCLAFVLRLAVLRLRRIPVVWTIHNLLPHESRHPRVDWLLARIAAGLSQGLIVHSETARQEAMRMWRLRDPGRFTVIPHANYVGQYRNDIDRARARRKLGIAPSRIVILFLGAVRPYKGVLPLIESFRTLADERAFLLIAGKPLDAAFTEAVQRCICGDESVRFDAGFVNDDDVQTYMNAADIVALPYREVLSSGAALLAMSFARPCIAPRQGCLSDVLDSSGAFFYDWEQGDGLATALRRALDAREHLDGMGAYNQKRASEWTWERMAEMTARLYRECLAQGKKDRKLECPLHPSTF